LVCALAGCHIAIQHTNRKGQTYYLHQQRSKTGAFSYHFAMKAGGVVEEIPEGYEIHENVRGQVFLRRKTVKQISDEEMAMLRDVLDRQPHRPIYQLEEKGAVVTVYQAEDPWVGGHDIMDYHLRLQTPEERRRRIVARANYTAMMRFTLAGSNPRRFEIERYCFRGSVERWIYLAGPDRLAALAEKYLPHLGRDSFFELF
jgi:hypothetical protein